jgi:hypothetical protein
LLKEVFWKIFNAFHGHTCFCKITLKKKMPYLFLIDFMRIGIQISQFIVGGNESSYDC